MMAPYQLALLLGLWLAWRPRPRWSAVLLATTFLAGTQIVTILVLGEWALHTSIEPHVALIRAWSVTAPVALFLGLVLQQKHSKPIQLIPVTEASSG